MFAYKGIGTALVTPFNPDFTIDFESLTTIIEHLIAHGTDYLVALGTTGEVATLSKQEKDQIIRHVVQTVAGRVPVVVGMGGNNTLAICQDLQTTNLGGVSAILSVSPYYNKPNQAGIINHYKLISQASPLPIIIYNVPGRTGSNMTAQTQLAIAQLPNVIATKEASGNMEQVMTIIKNKPQNFEVISGDDALTYAMIACGAVGVISVINHALTATFNSMVHQALAGNWAQAQALHYQALDASIAIFEDGSPSGIKEMLHQLNLCGTTSRPPVYPVNEALASRLRAMVS